MCDVCQSGNSPDEALMDLSHAIMDAGHQVIAIPTSPPFAYTVGCFMTENMPEFCIYGFSPVKALHILNGLVESVRKGDFVIDGDVIEVPEKTVLNVACRLVRCDPEAAQMIMARRISGNELVAYQLVWPDENGHYPDDPRWDDMYTQPVFAAA